MSSGGVLYIGIMLKKVPVLIALGVPLDEKDVSAVSKWIAIEWEACSGGAHFFRRRVQFLHGNNPQH